MNNDFPEHVSAQKFKKMLNLDEVWYFDVEEFCEIVDDLLDENNTNLAEKALKIALGQHPESASLEMKKLEYHLAKGDVKKSRQIINILHPREMNNVDFVVNLGRFYSLIGKWMQSIKLYQKAISLGEDSVHLNNLIANEYFHQNRFSFALKHFKKSISQNPKDEYVLQAIVDCYVNLGRIKTCILFLRKYIDKFPYSHLAWHELGLNLMEVEEYEQAIEAFDYEYLIKPEDINSIYLIAECHKENGDYNKALLSYSSLLENEEHSASINFKIGECYSKLHEYDKAISHYKVATYYDPHLDKAWFAKSLMYEKLDKFLESKHSVNRALEYEKHNLDYLRQSAYIHIELGEYEEAEQRFKLITHQNPKEIKGWFARSEILVLLGDYEIALEVLNEALETIGENDKLRYQQSYCYYLLGELEKSSFSLEKSEKLNPEILNQIEREFPHLKKRNKYIRKLKKGIIDD